MKVSFPWSTPENDGPHGPTADARSYDAGLSELKVVPIDSPQLADLMTNFDVGVSEEERYVVTKLD